MTMVLRWRLPDAAVSTEWLSPPPELAGVAVIIGPPGPQGPPGEAGVETFSGGTTGLTPTVATGGAVTLAGTLNAAHGGTGATALTGYVKGAGQDAFTAVTGIPAADISTPIDCGTFN